VFVLLQGQADHEVLEVFRSAYEEVRRGYNDQLINERKTNLAALLLDIANKEGDPSLFPKLPPSHKQTWPHSLQAISLLARRVACKKVL
jgi:hypothetical protein